LLFFREKVRVNGREEKVKKWKNGEKSLEARRYINILMEGGDMKG
jgi:hypothetical protein